MLHKPSLASTFKILIICFIFLTIAIVIYHHDIHTTSPSSSIGTPIIPKAGSSLVDAEIGSRRLGQPAENDNIVHLRDSSSSSSSSSSQHTDHQSHKKLPLLKNESHIVRVMNIWQHFQLRADKHFKHLLNTDKAKSYHNNLPFPHTFFDDVFPPEMIELVMQEIPDVVEFTPQGCPKHAQICWVTPTEKKAAMREHFQMFTNAMISFLKGATFLNFLSKLTNITTLYSDPYNLGSGVHQIVRGGYLKVHADFNRGFEDTMHRRVNVFIFLNPFWKDSFGGFLELWSRNLTMCKPLKPRIGRLVIFSTDDFAYHGHPDPLNCPIHRSRKSIAQYYYTSTRPASECENFNCSSRGETKWVYPPKACAESILIHD